MLSMNHLEDSSKKHPFPCPCTYRTALSYYLDVTSNPRTHVLKELAEYTTDPEVCCCLMKPRPSYSELFMFLGKRKTFENERFKPRRKGTLPAMGASRQPHLTAHSRRSAIVQTAIGSRL